jgi:flagellar hook assembly protein FlgD
VRRTAAGLVAGLLVVGIAWTTAPVPATAAVSADPKVVLVVGATHGATADYRSWMNVVAATASRYSHNVVKVYSPNATWAAVKKALQGASIVVYMGHGNGFPSPYSTKLNPATQDGMGLNAAAGAGDSNTKYYGESYFASDVDLAPNAVVILSHNCYASGNSEPGKTEPTLAVAKARMDNFAAGFLKAGARAVIADGHSDPSWYVEQLFTSRTTVEQIWRTGPRPHGHVFSFASVRSSGYTVYSDPDSKSGTTYSGFYRSLVTRPTLTSEQVTGAAYARTDGTPATFVVPGAAEVTAAAGVGLYADAALTPDPESGLPPASLAPGTRLRLLAAAGKAPDGAAVFQVATLDGSASGFVSATGLAPRDSYAPKVWEVDPGAGALSPNGDGSGDTLAITARASEAVAWHAVVSDPAGATVESVTGTGERLAFTWDGLDAGSPRPDGTYTATFTVKDSWGNAPGTASVELVVDTVKPALDQVVAQGTAPVVFSPNGDGVADSARFGFTSTEAGSILGKVRNAAGTTIGSFTQAMPAGAGSATWDGATSAGGTAPDGTYSVALAPRDRAGNVGASIATSVDVYKALGFVKASVSAFYPSDLDTLSRTVRFSFVLASPATVTTDLLGPTGAVVRPLLAAVEMAAGSSTWTWDGRLANGKLAPRGTYRLRVQATDGTRSVTQAAKVTLDAFRMTISDTTPGRGQLVTIKVVTTEKLATLPKIRVEQPGVARRIVATHKVATSTYAVTVRLARGGTAGTLGFKVVATDSKGGSNWSRFAYPLH